MLYISMCDPQVVTVLHSMGNLCDQVACFVLGKLSDSFALHITHEVTLTTELRDDIFEVPFFEAFDHARDVLALMACQHCGTLRDPILLLDPYIMGNIDLLDYDFEASQFVLGEENGICGGASDLLHLSVLL